jgi:hypothetical protein
MAQTSPEAVNPHQPAWYVQAGAMVGVAAPVDGLNLMAALEAGWRIPDSLAWVHAAASYGPAGDDQGSGSNGQLRAGIEGRPCTSDGEVCGVGGVDVGYQRGRWTSKDNPADGESVDAAVAIPRFGVDIGGASLRVRFGIELDVALFAQKEVTSRQTTDPVWGPIALELGAGIAYQW